MYQVHQDCYCILLETNLVLAKAWVPYMRSVSIMLLIDVHCNIANIGKPHVVRSESNFN